MGRLGKNKMGETNYEKGESCFFFIRQHHAPLTIFRYYETNLMLLNPTETWFVIKILMVERLFKVKPTIEQIVVDPNWTTFVNSFYGNHH